MKSQSMLILTGIVVVMLIVGYNHREKIVPDQGQNYQTVMDTFRQKGTVRSL